MTFDELNASKNSDGLIPAIIQDDNTRQVLMLGYMNREAFDKTVAERRVTFFSRTKGRLWTKGETSGNFLNVCSIVKDCDDDTLLIRVNPVGPVCHKGTKSCFGGRENEGFLGTLEAVIRQRHKEMPEDSYTTKLFNRGVKKIAKKVGEEATETVIEAVANNKSDFVYEVSDLLYHLIVLMENQGVTMAEIEEELAGRHQ